MTIQELEAKKFYHWLLSGKLFTKNKRLIIENRLIKIIDNRNYTLNNKKADYFDHYERLDLANMSYINLLDLISGSRVDIEEAILHFMEIIYAKTKQYNKLS